MRALAAGARGRRDGLWGRSGRAGARLGGTGRRGASCRGSGWRLRRCAAAYGGHCAHHRGVRAACRSGGRAAYAGCGQGDFRRRCGARHNRFGRIGGSGVPVRGARALRRQDSGGHRRAQRIRPDARLGRDDAGQSDGLGRRRREGGRQDDHLHRYGYGRHAEGTQPDADGGDLRRRARLPRDGFGRREFAVRRDEPEGFGASKPARGDCG